MKEQDFIDAIVRLFREPRALPRCEILRGDAWAPVPLEWNTAKRLADTLGTRARMVDAAGDVVRWHG